MKNQFLSFKCAFRGVVNTIKSESHMRFHIVAGIYVVIFAMFYELSMTQWAVLILLITLILASEVVNTCIENLCNLTSDHFEPLVKLAKDAAAGAVLIEAVGAVIIAFVFFFNTNTFMKIIAFFANNIFMLILLVLSGAISIIFIGFGPVKIKNSIIHIFLKNKK